MRNYKYLIMLILGGIITFFPNSLLSMLIFVLGSYLVFVGATYFISGIRLLKYKKGVEIDLVRGTLLFIAGIAIFSNSPNIARILSGLLFVVIGVCLLFIGVVTSYKNRELSSGIVLIAIGGLFAIFPLGVSVVITRLLGITLIIISTYLMSKSKSS